MPIDSPEDQYAANPPPMMQLSDAKRIARLAHLITLRSAKDAPKGVILDVKSFVPWEEIPEYRRTAMAAGVVRVVQALEILGYIER